MPMSTNNNSNNNNNGSNDSDNITIDSWGAATQGTSATALTALVPLESWHRSSSQGTSLAANLENASGFICPKHFEEHPMIFEDRNALCPDCEAEFQATRADLREKQMHLSRQLMQDFGSGAGEGHEGVGPYKDGAAKGNYDVNSRLENWVNDNMLQDLQASIQQLQLQTQQQQLQQNRYDQRPDKDTERRMNSDYFNMHDGVGSDSAGTDGTVETRVQNLADRQLTSLTHQQQQINNMSSINGIMRSSNITSESIDESKHNAAVAVTIEHTISGLSSSLASTAMAVASTTGNSTSAAIHQQRTSQYQRLPQEPHKQYNQHIQEHEQQREQQSRYNPQLQSQYTPHQQTQYNPHSQQPSSQYSQQQQQQPPQQSQYSNQQYSQPQSSYVHQSQHTSSHPPQQPSQQPAGPTSHPYFYPQQSHPSYPPSTGPVMQGGFTGNIDQSSSLPGPHLPPRYPGSAPLPLIPSQFPNTQSTATSMRPSTASGNQQPRQLVNEDGKNSNTTGNESNLQQQFMREQQQLSHMMSSGSALQNPFATFGIAQPQPSTMSMPPTYLGHMPGTMPFSSPLSHPSTQAGGQTDTAEGRSGGEYLSSGAGGVNHSFGLSGNGPGSRPYFSANPTSSANIPNPLGFSSALSSSSSFDALAIQIQRMQQMQDWMLWQKETECQQLRQQLHDCHLEQQQFRVDNALLQEKLQQQEERMQHELRLIKMAALQQQHAAAAAQQVAAAAQVTAQQQVSSQQSQQLVVHSSNKQQNRKGSNRHAQQQQMMVVSPSPEELASSKELQREDQGQPSKSLQYAYQDHLFDDNEAPPPPPPTSSAPPTLQPPLALSADNSSPCHTVKTAGGRSWAHGADESVQTGNTSDSEEGKDAFDANSITWPSQMSINSDKNALVQHQERQQRKAGPVSSPDRRDKSDVAGSASSTGSADRRRRQMTHYKHKVGPLVQASAIQAQRALPGTGNNDGINLGMSVRRRKEEAEDKQNDSESPWKAELKPLNVWRSKTEVASDFSDLDHLTSEAEVRLLEDKQEAVDDKTFPNSKSDDLFSESMFEPQEAVMKTECNIVLTKSSSDDDIRHVGNDSSESDKKDTKLIHRSRSGNSAPVDLDELVDDDLELSDDEKVEEDMNGCHHAADNAVDEKSIDDGDHKDEALNNAFPSDDAVENHTVDEQKESRNNGDVNTEDAQIRNDHSADDSIPTNINFDGHAPPSVPLEENITFGTHTATAIMMFGTSFPEQLSKTPSEPKYRQFFNVGNGADYAKPSNIHADALPQYSANRLSSPMSPIGGFSTPSIPTAAVKTAAGGFSSSSAKVSFVDDSASIGQTVASSTFGEDRQKVDCQEILDPYGDKGEYTGIILRSTGMPHGSGEMIYQEDKRTYTGEWRHGRWHGFGKATFANGDQYEGEYRFDQRHGRGKYQWHDGRVYDGMFREDKRHGRGKFIWPDGAVYEGEFRNGQREGQGTYTFSDGGRYEGSWRDGRYSGFGICSWEDGRCYKGEWLNGMAHGKGIETFSDGSIRHDGQWFEDEPVLN